jgi:hypothetical protein
MGVAPAANDAVSPEIIISGQFSGQLFRAFAPGDIGRSGNAPHRHEVFMLDQLLSDRDVEKITGRARSTLQKDRIVGTGIPFVRLGRLVRYRSSDVTAFIDALPSCRSTSETARDGEAR